MTTSSPDSFTVIQIWTFSSMYMFLIISHSLYTAKSINKIWIANVKNKKQIPLPPGIKALTHLSLITQSLSYIRKAKQKHTCLYLLTSHQVNRPAERDRIRNEALGLAQIVHTNSKPSSWGAGSNQRLQCKGFSFQPNKTLKKKIMKKGRGRKGTWETKYHSPALLT